MKIAVFISGEYREFPVAHKFWSFLKWENIDTYFVSWDRTLYVDKNPSEKPVLLHVNENDITKYITPKKIVLLDYNHPFNQNKMYSGGAMIFLWRQCIQILEQTNENYDYVIIIRPDLALYYNDEVLQKFFSCKINNSDRCIYLINSAALGFPQVFGSVENISDLIIVGSKNAVVKLKYLSLDVFYKLTPPNLINIHNFLAKEMSNFYTYAHNLPIEDWCIVRSTSHLQCEKTFNECKNDSKDWWETKYQLPGSYSTRKNLTSYEINTWMNTV